MDLYMECGGVYTINGEKVFGRNLFVDPEDVEDIRQRFHNTDVYCTPYIYNCKDQSKSDLYAPLYIDMDMEIHSESDFNKIRRDLLHVITGLNIQYHVPMEQIRIYFSGHKGFHVMVMPEVFGIKPHRKLNEHFKTIAAELKSYTMFKTVDTKIYDDKRLFRLPNSINGKTGLFKVPLDCEYVRSCSYAELTEYASLPREKTYPEPKLVNDAAAKYKEVTKQVSIPKDQPRYNGPHKIKKIPPCVDNILKTGATQGRRNATTVILASILAQTGKELDQVMEEMLNWNSEKVTPKLPDREVRATVKSAYTGATNNKKYGCRAIKELGLCVPNKCGICNNK